MTIYGRRILVLQLRHQLEIDWWGHHHGIAHWARVRANDLTLADRTGANRHVVELFTFFHDSRRFNEHVDDGHGARGASVASALRASTLTPPMKKWICCTSPVCITAMA